MTHCPSWIVIPRSLFVVLDFRRDGIRASCSAVLFLSWCPHSTA